MRRIFIFLFMLVLLGLLSIVPSYAATIDLVHDDTNTLGEGQLAALLTMANKIADSYDMDVGIVLVDSLEGNDVDIFAEYIYEEYDFGQGADKSGALLLISLEDRDYSLLAQGYGNTVYTDYGKDVLMDGYVLPLMSEDDFFTAFTVFLQKSDEFIEAAKAGQAFDIHTDPDYEAQGAKKNFWIRLAVTILLPILLAVLINASFLRKMKTARLQVAADHYIPDGGFILNHSSDVFLYRTETRRKIERDSNSGGGGGGTTTNSRGYSSKSGKF